MRAVLTLIAGVLLGFVAAHIVDNTPRGHEALARLDTRLDGFRRAVAAGYRSREAELGSRLPE
jgi:uncharacterized membrane-anchored protein YhcB (DUF1043 family)